jgi:hypothetical protein
VLFRSPHDQAPGHAAPGPDAHGHDAPGHFVAPEPEPAPVADSYNWARYEMHQANHIYEPSQKTGWKQLGNMTLWALEGIAIWLLVTGFPALIK